MKVFRCFSNLPFITSLSVLLLLFCFLIQPYSANAGTPIGACCLFGSCSVLDIDDCVDPGGDFLGDDSSCEGIECEQPTEAIFLLIDEDSIDNGGPYFVGGTGGTEFEFIDTDVNDNKADLGLRAELPFFAAPPANIGNTITLLTGEMGDEAWFAPNEIPDTWASTGPTPDGIRNFVGLPPGGVGLPPGGVGAGLGTGSDPEALLDKIPDVRPLRAEGLNQLIGQAVCAVVYDSDISINYEPLNGSLKGANYGIVAFVVISVTAVAGLLDFSDSSLPEVEIVILDAEEVCDSDLMLFVAPVPMTSSEEIDVLPDGVVPDASG